MHELHKCVKSIVLKEHGLKCTQPTQEAASSIKADELVKMTAQR